MPTRPDPNRELELNAIFEEYHAMYDLAVFRLNALDRRAPVTVAAFATVLVSLQSLPVSAQLLVLLFLPPSLVWFMRTTVNHARSFEDALRRIEELEKSANARLSEPLLCFQSRHPSRGREVGGRTGRETLLAVLGSILLMLAVAAYQIHTTSVIPRSAHIWYDLFLIVIAATTVNERVKLSRYSYREMTTGQTTH